MNSQTWFTSDLHLSQVNIIKKLSKWDKKDTTYLRDFNSTTEMNEHIIQKINEYVKPTDELYILGDLYFGTNIYEMMTYIRRINTQNRNLIYGNHDGRLKDDAHKNMMSRLFKSICYYKEINKKYPLEGQDLHREPWKGYRKICMSHYAMRVWNQSHRGSWMLHGHSHASLERGNHDVNKYYNKHLTMDVGIDNIFRLKGEYRPISENEIEELFKNRQNLVIDHHGSN